MSLSTREIRTVCGFCHANCGMIIETRDGIINKIRGDREHPASQGVLCPKGLAAGELVHSPDRLQHPLKKTSGGFKQISWDEALDTIASRLGEIKELHGAETLVWCCGAPVTTQAAYGFVQLAAAYGSPNFTGPGHLCSMPRGLAMRLVIGDRSQPDYENTRFMLLWGANPTDSRQLAEGSAAYGRFDRVIAEAKGRGAKLVVVDPRRTAVAAIADEWLQINVGTDAALGLAMLNVIIGEGLHDKEFVNEWTIGFDELEKHVRQFTPQWAEVITGIPADKIIDVARAFATTKPAIIHDGNGLDQHINVVQSVRALGMLSAITGNVDIPGGNAFFPGPKLGRYLTVRPEVKRLSADEFPLFPSVPFPSVVDSILSEKSNRTRAMIVHHANPLLINANEKIVRKALEQLDFLVVSDIFPSATAQMADLILPDTSDFERFGYEEYSSTRGGFIALHHKVVEPIGESRSAFDIEYELAKRMGLEKCFPWKNTEEWVDYRLKPLGITLEELIKKSVIYTTDPITYRKYLEKGFNTPSGKVELYSRRLNDHGYDPLPVYRDFTERPEVVEKYPLVGTTRKPGMYVHTRYRNLPMLHRLQPDPLIWMHPDDARARAIGEGDETTVTSAEGNISVEANLTEEVKSGAIIIDFGWGNPWDGKANVNTLTSDEPRDNICAATPNRRFLCEAEKA
ncbi:molybdopterin-dependent oxidoreductase [Chloroflexota bacterium]